MGAWLANLVSKSLGSSVCSAPTSCGALGRSPALPGPQFPYLYNPGLAPLTLCNSMTPGCQSQEGYTNAFHDFILAGTAFTGEFSWLPGVESILSWCWGGFQKVTKASPREGQRSGQAGAMGQHDKPASGLFIFVGPETRSCQPTGGDALILTKLRSARYINQNANVVHFVSSRAREGLHYRIAFL